MPVWVRVDQGDPVVLDPGQSTVKGQPTYIDILCQHLIRRSVFPQDEIINRSSRSHRPGQKPQRTENNPVSKTRTTPKL